MIDYIFIYKGPHMTGIMQANCPENKYSNVTGYLVWQLFPTATSVPTGVMGQPGNTYLQGQDQGVPRTRDMNKLMCSGMEGSRRQCQTP